MVNFIDGGETSYILSDEQERTLQHIILAEVWSTARHQFCCPPRMHQAFFCTLLCMQRKPHLPAELVLAIFGCTKRGDFASFIENVYVPL